MRRQDWLKELYRPVTPARMILIFILASLLGNLIETIFCGILEGAWGSRQGVVYGPFSPIYGIGAVLLVLLTLPLAKGSRLLLFLTGALVGGGYEVLGSLLESHVLHGTSWDYSSWGIPLLGGRTSVAFMVMWGLVSVVWMRWLYPALNAQLDALRPGPMRAAAYLLGGLMAADLLISGLALERWSDRVLGRPADTKVEIFLDRHYPDSRMEPLFSNLQFSSHP